MQESPYADKPTDPELVQLHDRMRAKLIGFLHPMNQVLQSYPESDTSLPARYARAIAYCRVPDFEKALAGIVVPLRGEPGDQYFPELEGEMRRWSGPVAGAGT